MPETPLAYHGAQRPSRRRAGAATHAVVACRCWCPRRPVILPCLRRNPWWGSSRGSESIAATSLSLCAQEQSDVWVCCLLAKVEATHPPVLSVPSLGLCSRSQWPFHVRDGASTAPADAPWAQPGSITTHRSSPSRTCGRLAPPVHHHQPHAPPIAAAPAALPQPRSCRLGLPAVNHVGAGALLPRAVRPVPAHRVPV